MSESKIDYPALEPTALESGPVVESSRLRALDTTRAIALLGIFFVNAALFAEPFIEILQPHQPVNEGLASLIVYWLTSVFCNGKFYPLFSILFGVGLAIMYQGTVSRGGKFGWTFLRRLLGLAIFGFLHVTLLWWGDVLLIYAFVGLWMLLLGKRKPRTLLIVAAIVFAVGQCLAIAFISLMIAIGSSKVKVDAVEKQMPAASSALAQFAAVLIDLNEQQAYDTRLMSLEREFNTQGPFVAAAAIRLFHYLFCLPFFLTTFIWVVLPCFCVGAALLKLGFFHGQLPSWRNKFIRLGLFVGLPLNVLAAIGTLFHGHFLGSLIATVGLSVGGPMMSLMYLSLIMNWVDSGRAAGLVRGLANLGKMGLTGYLLESTLMSGVMTFWGLQRFGNTTWIERAGWVVAIYLVILLFANIWMARFRFGPLEWLWRSFTYLHWQPIRR